MIVSLFMAKKQISEGYVTEDKHFHCLSVLNQVLKRVAYLQKGQHGPVWNEHRQHFMSTCKDLKLQN